MDTGKVIGVHATPHDRNDYEGIARPTPRNLLISPNLIAALEYDERTRAIGEGSLGALAATNSNSSCPCALLKADALIIAAGLPPPPRPRSGAGSTAGSSRRTRIQVGPAPAITQVAGCANRECCEHAAPPPPSPPVREGRIVSHYSPSASDGLETTTSNPYINPAPLLPYYTLPVESPTQLTPERERETHPMAIGRGVRTRKSAGSVDSVIQPRPADRDVQRGLQRHRYFSSVEKVLGMGKAAFTIGKSSNPGALEREKRRGSNVSLPDMIDGDQGMMKNGIMRQYRRDVERAKTPSSFSSGEYSASAPVSPVLQAEATMHSSRRATSPAEVPVGNRSVGHADDMSIYGKSTHTRPYVSHSRESSVMSMNLSPSSDSSHERPSTPQSRKYIPPNNVYPASSPPQAISFHTPFHHRSFGRSPMSADRESFIDLASPTFSPSMQSPEFASNSTHPRTHELMLSAYPKVIVNREHSQPLPARLNLANITTTPSAHKPPRPTAPKPDFKRSKSAQRFSPSDSSPDSPQNRKSSAPSTSDPLHRSRDLPPTTNYLKPQERAERVRKNQKLTQLFGQTPGVLEVPSSDDVKPGIGFFSGGILSSSLVSKRKHQRGAVSMSDNQIPPSSLEPLNRAVWPPPEGTQYLALGPRRHSAPLSPDDFSTYDEQFYPLEHAPEATQHGRVSTRAGSEDSAPHRSSGSYIGDAPPGKAVDGPGSPMSFIDLSDEDVTDGVASIINVETPKADNRRRGLAYSPLTSPLLDSLSPDELVEEERRRKREKLVKLHRFLGSRVPTDLVFGQVLADMPLPPISPESVAPVKNSVDMRKVWMRRRRSSSAAEFSASWSGDIDRLKEDLNDREKAINVRRAIKMEKMFGVAPPQTLYHTRLTPPPGSSGPVMSSKHDTPPVSPSYSGFRNVNQTAYKGKGKKLSRPDSTGSTEALLSSVDSSGHGLSDIYLHYRHSLNSLNDIIDRDDKESLAELHDYLHGNWTDALLQQYAPQDDALSITSPSTRTERRRSLPSRTSMVSTISVSSELSAVSPKESTHQVRVRRAAKLTQFFGVDYRVLMSEILESIEKGLEEERGRGTLKPDEVQDLLQKLVKLKSKRNSLS